MNKTKKKNIIVIKKLRKEAKEATKEEVLIDSLQNFVYAFVSATIIVFITLRNDYSVFVGYFVYYSVMSIILNKSKYTTTLGKNIIFPLTATLGAFLGYKIAPYLSQIL